MPAAESQPMHASLPVGTIAMLIVAVFLYAAMMANVGEIQNADTGAMGRGFASAFSVFFGIAEWLVLAVLMLIAGVKGDMPNWSAIVAAILLPLSGIGAMMAMGLLDRGAGASYQLVPGLLPPLIAAYALWARIPALHGVLRPLPTSLAAWAAIAVPTVVPIAAIVTA